MAESCGLKLSILLSPLPDDARTLPEALRRMEEACATLKADGSEEPFVYTLSQPVEQDVNPCRQLQTYIRSHLKDDLSLTQLGNITGYNGDYLNRMFRRETGEPHWPLYRGLQIGAAAEPSAGPGYDHRTGRVGGGLYLPLLFQPLCAPGNRHVAQFFPGNATGRSQIGKSV